MISKYCNLKNTALPEKMMMSILSADIRRRMLNMDKECNEKDVAKVIDD